MYSPARSPSPTPELPPSPTSRLFHVSEASDLECFVPRLPPSTDAGVHHPVVWALHEDRLINYLVPRDCPRVTYYAKASTTACDRQTFFASPASRAVVVIEAAWWSTALHTPLFLYEFDPADFVPSLPEAGYWTSTVPVEPVAVHRLSRPLDQVLLSGAELRVVPDLHATRAAVLASSLAFSCLRMRNADRGPRTESPFSNGAT
jgi:hypothetical protein